MKEEIKLINETYTKLVENIDQTLVKTQFLICVILSCVITFFLVELTYKIFIHVLIPYAKKHDHQSKINKRIKQCVEDDNFKLEYVTGCHIVDTKPKKDFFWLDDPIGVTDIKFDHTNLKGEKIHLEIPKGFRPFVAKIVGHIKRKVNPHQYTDTVVLYDNCQSFKQVLLSDVKVLYKESESFLSGGANPNFLYRACLDTSLYDYVVEKKSNNCAMNVYQYSNHGEQNINVDKKKYFDGSDILAYGIYNRSESTMVVQGLLNYDFNIYDLEIK